MDTHIAKILTFRHWNIEGEINTLLEYKGPEYIVFNDTANCARAIATPLTRDVTESCDEEDFIDPELQKWVQVDSAEDPRNYIGKHTFISEFHTQSVSLIYCFTRNITVYGREDYCPNAVIQIESDEPYTIEGRRPWVPKKVNIKRIYGNDLLGEIHGRHQITNSSLNTRANVEYQLIEAKREIRRFKKVEAEVVSVRSSVLSGIGTVVLSLSLLALTLFIASSCYKYSCYQQLKWLFTQDHRQEQPPVVYPLPRRPTAPNVADEDGIRGSLLSINQPITTM